MEEFVTCDLNVFVSVSEIRIRNFTALQFQVIAIKLNI